MKKVSFRFASIFTFVILSFFVIFIVLYMHSTFSHNLAKKVSDSEFKMLLSDFNQAIDAINDTQESYVDIFSLFLKNKNIDELFTNREEYIKMYIDFLTAHKDISSLYVGTCNDDFFLVKKVGIQEATERGKRIPFKTHWIIREIKNGEETRTYKDEKENTISSFRLKADLKPTARPWYKKALEANGQIAKTSPYEFYFFYNKGITYAKKYKKKYVFGMDFLIIDMNAMLDSKITLKSQSSCLIDENFNIIAKTKKLDENVAKKIFSIAKTNPKINPVEINGKQYVFSLEPLGKDFLLSFANFDTLLKPYKEEFKKNIFIGITIVLILSFSVGYLASIIIRPILLLARENKKIEQNKLNEVKLIPSKIKEISDLSSSLYNMSKSIKEKREELEKLSTTDSLTKIYNRAKINQSLEICINSHTRYKHNFGIMIIDIDYFKKVNDQYGHQVGDQFLVEFVNVLKKEIRTSDLIGRWGGEEFVIICKEISITDLEKTAQKLREKVATHNFKLVGHKTASFGIALYQKDESIEQLISRADEALYIAKNNGRNLVIKG